MNWSKEEEALLKERYSTYPLIDLGNQLKKSVRSIKHKAARLGLSRGKPPVNKPLGKNHREEVEKRYYEKHKDRIYSNKVERMKKRKTDLSKILGGKCKVCGYNRCVEALEFHHNGENKEGNIAHLIKNSSEEKALKEIKKCILLCANCHRELHHYKGS